MAAQEAQQLIIDAPAVAPERRRRPVVALAALALFAAAVATTATGRPSTFASLARVHGKGHASDDGAGALTIDDVVVSVDDATVAYTSVPTQLSVRNAPMPGPAPTPAVTPIPGTPVPTSVVTNSTAYDCPSTCSNNTCTHFYDTYGYSCHTMESEYGCDCSGCACS